jgi:hypothetical protein
MATTYRSIVGGIMYAMTCTRPDLSFAASQLARLMAKPTSCALAAAKHTLRYLKANPGLPLVYHRAADITPNVMEMYVDASWASDPDTGKSTSGYVALLNGAAVSWKTQRQSTVALSTSDSEYIALCEAARDCLFLRGLLADMNAEQTFATAVHEDNQPAMHLANNAETTSRSKHLLTAMHFVRDLINDGTLAVQYCPTHEMLADSFTKGGVPRDRFQQHRARFMGLEHFGG